MKELVFRKLTFLYSEVLLSSGELGRWKKWFPVSTVAAHVMETHGDNVGNLI